MSTTNGTLALTAASAGARVIVASWLNFQAVVDDLVRTGAEPVLLCAGREKVFGLEDAVCAGQLAAAVMKALPEEEWELNDGALAALALAEEYPDPAKLFPVTAAGRSILEAGLGDDLAYCAQRDLRDAVPVLHDRQVTLAASYSVILSPRRTAPVHSRYVAGRRIQPRTRTSRGAAAVTSAPAVPIRVDNLSAVWVLFGCRR
jgi:phosphosulfolactate phosphohydrolase-like enzyme